MEINDNLNIQPPTPLTFVLQMVTVPKQQIILWPICDKESKVTDPRLRLNRDRCATATNTVNIVNKLVTIFAPYLDSFIVTNNHHKHLFSTAISGS